MEEMGPNTFGASRLVWWFYRNSDLDSGKMERLKVRSESDQSKQTTTHNCQWCRVLIKNWSGALFEHWITAFQWHVGSRYQSVMSRDQFRQWSHLEQGYWHKNEADEIIFGCFRQQNERKRSSSTQQPMSLIKKTKEMMKIKMVNCRVGGSKFNLYSLIKMTDSG